MLLDELSVTELLLRRSPLTRGLAALFDLDEAYLHHAERTVTDTLVCPWPRIFDGVRRMWEACGRKCGACVEKCEFAEDRPIRCGFETNDRV